MPSSAYLGYLEPLLTDARALIEAHTHLSAGSLLPPDGLDALLRAVVLMCISAWEGYVEEVVRLAVRFARPATPTLGVWSALDSFVQKSADRFNTPNADNVRALIAAAIGLLDIRMSWSWINHTPARARERLAEAMTFRHQIAHGANPRPVVGHHYASRLPFFFRCLGRLTDRAVRIHLVREFGVPQPWPE